MNKTQTFATGIIAAVMLAMVVQMTAQLRSPAANGAFSLPDSSIVGVSLVRAELPQDQVSDLTF
jgi:hypothetical protein